MKKRRGGRKQNKMKHGFELPENIHQDIES